MMSQITSTTVIFVDPTVRYLEASFLPSECLEEQKKKADLWIINGSIDLLLQYDLFFYINQVHTLKVPSEVSLTSFLTGWIQARETHLWTQLVQQQLQGLVPPLMSSLLGTTVPQTQYFWLTCKNDLESTHWQNIQIKNIPSVALRAEMTIHHATVSAPNKVTTVSLPEPLPTLLTNTTLETSWVDDDEEEEEEDQAEDQKDQTNTS